MNRHVNLEHNIARDSKLGVREKETWTMTSYVAAAVQAVYSGMITFIVATLMYSGVTADVTSLTVMAIALAYGLTLMLSLLREFLIRRTAEPEVVAAVPEPAEALKDNPWQDPDLVDDARSLMAEDDIREFWRNASVRGTGKGRFERVHWPIVNYVQKG